MVEAWTEEAAVGVVRSGYILKGAVTIRTDGLAMGCQRERR